jgi:hypothetical protein
MISFNTVKPPMPESKIPIDLSKAYDVSINGQCWPTMIFLVMDSRLLLSACQGLSVGALGIAFFR